MIYVFIVLWRKFNFFSNFLFLTIFMIKTIILPQNSSFSHRGTKADFWYVVCMCFLIWKSNVSFLLQLQTKKSMPGLVYIFWHIFIVNYINNKFLKYKEFVNVLWCSKLYFSPISYICPYKFFFTLSAIFVKNSMKNQNLYGQNYSFYQYKQDLSCYFHDFEKKVCLYHLSLSPKFG
jgi:hypothetical protein